MANNMPKRKLKHSEELLCLKHDQVGFVVPTFHCTKEEAADHIKDYLRVSPDKKFKNFIKKTYKVVKVKVIEL